MRRKSIHLDKGDNMDYEYQITEGGTYTVKAYAPEDVAEATSNEVEVGEMLITLQDATVGILATRQSPYDAGTPYVDVHLNVSNPIGGQQIGVSLDGPTGLNTLAAAGGVFTLTGSTSTFMVRIYLVVDRSKGVCYVNNGGTTNERQYWHKLSNGGRVFNITTDKSITTFGSSKIIHLTLPSLTYRLTPYTNVLEVSALADAKVQIASLGFYQRINCTFLPSGTYTIDVSNVVEPEKTFSDFNTHIPRGSTSVRFVGGATSGALSAYFNPTTPPVSVDVKQLEAPVLAYSASEGKLQWNEVTGADRYEVWKDGVKIADIPKKT